ncbi:MAG: dual CXXC motif small (seleno)protein [Humidesulfovibrio sp.]|nr:dual CXXC motif small (seleno)protein [Humidesulfovibrio sp.]
MRCTGCGEKYQLQDFIDQMDEGFEEEVGFVPLDRL